MSESIKSTTEKKKGGRPPKWTAERVATLESLIKNNQKINIEDELKTKVFSGISQENFLKKLKELAGQVGRGLSMSKNTSSPQDDVKSKKDVKLSSRKRSTGESAKSEEKHTKKIKMETPNSTPEKMTENKLKNARSEKVYWVWRTKKHVIYAFPKPGPQNKCKIVFDKEERKIFKTIIWIAPKESEILSQLIEEKILSSEKELESRNSTEMNEDCTFIHAEGEHGPNFKVVSVGPHFCCVFDIESDRFVAKTLDLE